MRMYGGTKGLGHLTGEPILFSANHTNTLNDPKESLVKFSCVEHLAGRFGDFTIINDNRADV